ncbi:MAG: DNA primase [Patescibacteria group bacterium]|jgi:DNA primase
MADVDEIKSKLDIVEIIGEYLTLKKSGITYKGLCPFHSEKTPSFSVSAERQSWHCFGCNEGGDVISFVQKIDGLSFVEALSKLAARVGIEISPMSDKENQERSEKSKILEVLIVASNFYHQILLKSPVANLARQYLEKRGISTEMIEAFKIGYAPDGWHNIEAMLTKKGIDLEWAVKSGLSVKKTGSNNFYDRFRGRIMFPIDDASGQIIGFTGRILQDQNDVAKYLNTSESPAFRKSEALYGISLARKTIRSEDKVIVVEGQMDVITSHQFGFANTIATSGTALTRDHLKLLKRYTNQIYFAFDADAAGQKTLYSAAIMAWEVDLNPYAVTIPYGKDPDECIRHNLADWKGAVDAALPCFDFFLNQAFGGNANLTGVGKKAIVAKLSPLIAAVQNGLEKEEYLHRLAGKLGVSEAVLLNDQQASRPNSETAIKPQAVKPDGQEEQLIGVMLAYFDLLIVLPEIIFDNSSLQKVFDAISKAKKNNQKVDDIYKELPPAWKNRLNQLMMEQLRSHEQMDQPSIIIEISDRLARFGDREREGRIQQNTQAIATALKSGDKKKAQALLKSIENDIIVSNER